MQLHYAVIGSGAIGGYLGAKLQQAGKQVNFVARSNYNVLKQHGFTIEEIDATTQIAPLTVYSSLEALPTVDVLLLASKTMSNADLLPQLAKHLNPNGVIVILQNGIGYEQTMAQYLEATRIIAGVVVIKTTQIKPGYIKHYGFSHINLATYSADNNPVKPNARLTQIVNDLQQTGIDTQAYENYASIRWSKLCHNIPFNGLSVVLHADNKGLCTSSASVALMEALITEIVNAANHCGANLSLPTELQKAHTIIENIRATAEAGSPSMKDDYDHGRELELDAIYKNPLCIAEQHNLGMPLTRMLYQQLCFITGK